MMQAAPTCHDLRAQAETAAARCRKLAGFSEEPGRTTRTFLSPAMRDCHREIASWLEPLDAQVSIDAAGNLRAFYSATKSGAPRLLIGSHLDTVPDAGAFDGALGVVWGIGLLELLRGNRLPFTIEIIGFSEEEGVRFKTPFIGSRALVGKLDELILAKEDRHGISVRAAIENFGLNPEQIPQCETRDDVLGYIEIHIEQGPVLEEIGLALSAVEAIAGQSKLEVTFVGRANHAGTTPMHLRRDAIAAAAEWITVVEREAQRASGLVATVGALRAWPGATNVIAREACLALDVRHSADNVREQAVANLLRLAGEIAARRGLSARHSVLLNQKSVAMNPPLVAQIEEAMRRVGCKPHRMVSGAGHDAMILAEKVPAAMIFVRTPGGISHSPEETVHVEDVGQALAVGMHLLELLAASPEIATWRTQSA